MRAFAFVASPISSFPTSFSSGPPQLLSKIATEYVFFFMSLQIASLLCLGPSHFAPEAPHYFSSAHCMRHDLLLILWRHPLCVHVLCYNISHLSSLDGPQDLFFKGNANLPELFPSVLLLVGFHLPSLSVY